MKKVLSIIFALLMVVGVLASCGGSAPVAPGAPQPGVETQPSTPQNVDPLSDWRNYAFKLDGVVYKFPCEFSEFTNNGWAVNEYYTPESVAGLGISSAFLSKGEVSIYLYVYNPTGDALLETECQVFGIDVDNNGPTLELAGGLTFTSTPDDIYAVFGKDQIQVYDTDDYTTYSYYSPDYLSEYEFMLYKDDISKNSIEIKNKVEGSFEASTDVPAYLSTYVAPTSLGTDNKAPVFSLDGALYQLPAPISAFTANGWTFECSENNIPAGNTTYASLKKGDSEVAISIINLESTGTIAENCAVSRVSVDNWLYIGNIELPNGIKIGSTFSGVQTVVSNVFETSDSTIYYTDWSTGVSIDVNFDDSTNEVSEISVRCENWSY